VTADEASTAVDGGVRRLRGVVVMLDALGMKGVWARREPSTVVNAWIGLVDRLETATATVVAANASVCDGFHIAAFSDTIILTLEGRIEGEDLDKLVQLAGDALREPFLIGLLEGILLRGVIAAGDYYQSTAMTSRGPSTLLTIGPAIDEAAEWYEQSDWFGVSAVPSAAYVLDEGRELGKPLSDSVVPYDVPLRSGSALPGWVLDWPRGLVLARGAAARARVLSILAASTISPIAVSKYRHSLAFFDRRLEAHATTEPKPA
jgi:hypothetical protein